MWNDEMDRKTRFRNESGTSNIRNIPSEDSDVDTRQLIGIKKPLLIQRLRALAAGEA